MQYQNYNYYDAHFQSFCFTRLMNVSVFQYNTIEMFTYEYFNNVHANCISEYITECNQSACSVEGSIGEAAFGEYLDLDSILHTLSHIRLS